MSVEQKPIFIDSIDRLPPEDFLEYFWKRESVKVSSLPKFKAKSLAIANQVIKNEFTLCGETHTLSENFSWKVNPSKD